jgi:hypothetical protein
MRVDIPIEYADTTKRRDFTREDCVRIAAGYKKRKAERHAQGKPLPPLSVFMGKILNAAVSEDR